MEKLTSNTNAHTLLKDLCTKERVSLQNIYSKNALMLKSGVKLSRSPPNIPKLLIYLDECVRAFE